MWASPLIRLPLFLVLVEQKGHAFLSKFFSDLQQETETFEKLLKGHGASRRDETGRSSPHDVSGGNSASCVAAICGIT